MIKKTVTYEDFDGNETTEDIYFNLTKAELIEMEASEVGGMAKRLEQISKSDDPKMIMSTFKDILLRSYGEKSVDGRRFHKSDEIRENFASSLAYDALFFELCTNADAAAEFANGLAPKSLMEDVEKQKNDTKKLEALPVENQKFETTREELEAKLAEMKKQAGEK